VSVVQVLHGDRLDGFIAEPHSHWLFARKHAEDGRLNYGKFIADVGAMALGSTTYILPYSFGGTVACASV
jgi:hypothetical protein